MSVGEDVCRSCLHRVAGSCGTPVMNPLIQRAAEALYSRRGMDGFVSVTDRAAPGPAAEFGGRAVSMRRPRFVWRLRARPRYREIVRQPPLQDGGGLDGRLIEAVLRPPASVSAPLPADAGTAPCVRKPPPPNPPMPISDRRSVIDGGADGERSRLPRHRPRAGDAAAACWRASACPARRAFWRQVDFLQR